MTQRSDRLDSAPKIVEAAVRLFATRGYHAATLDEVAKSAGYTKGAVYYHFATKEQLLLEVLKTIERRSIDRTISALKEYPKDFRRQLETFVKCQTGWAGRHPDDLAIIMTMSIDFVAKPSPVRTQVLRHYRKIEKVLTRILEEGKRSGEFEADLNVNDTVLSLMGVHDGNMLLWYRSGKDPEVGRRLTHASFAAFAQAVTRRGKEMPADISLGKAQLAIRGTDRPGVAASKS